MAVAWKVRGRRAGEDVGRGGERVWWRTGAGVAKDGVGIAGG